MNKKKILIVEDDVLLAKDISQTLSNSGYSITSIVSSGQEALKKAEENRPDLVFMDIILDGEINGIETARQINARFSIPVIYITAYSDKKIVEAAKLTEPFGYMIKPINEKELTITAEIVLSKYEKKKKAEKSLSETKKKYYHLKENINEGIVIINKNGFISDVNKKFLEMNSYTRNELIGHPISEFLEEKSLQKYKEQIAVGAEGNHQNLDLIWKKKDKQEIFTVFSPKFIWDREGNLKDGIGVLTDVTEQRQVENELMRSQWELRRLSQHLQNVREKEGKRIAREIHDELGQALTALKIDLSYLSKKFVKESPNQKQFTAKIRAMSDLIDKTIKTVQKVSAELRPRLLDDLGLIPAIEWYTQDFQKRTTIECESELESHGIDLDSDCNTAIFRIFQEALTNVARHAEATRIKISLKKADGEIELLISDNGKGISEDDVFSPNSLGLIGMRERIRPFGGKIKLHSVPHKGTTLRVTLPVNKST